MSSDSALSSGAQQLLSLKDMAAEAVASSALPSGHHDDKNESANSMIRRKKRFMHSLKYLSLSLSLSLSSPTGSRSLSPGREAGEHVLPVADGHTAAASAGGDSTGAHAAVPGEALPAQDAGGLLQAHAPASGLRESQVCTASPLPLSFYSEFLTDGKWNSKLAVCLLVYSCVFLNASSPVVIGGL